MSHSSSPDEPQTPARVARPAPVPHARYVPITELPGPQHARALGSGLSRVARIVALSLLAVALVTVPMAWLQRDEAPTQADSKGSTAQHRSTASELGFSTTTRSPAPTPAAAPRVIAAPTARPTTRPTAESIPVPSRTTTPARPTAPATKPAAPEASVVVPPPQTALTNEIVRLTNVERVAAGLAPLTQNQCLTDQSNLRTEVLVSQDRFEHDPFGPVVAACGMPHTIGENIILGADDAASVVQGWMNSPGHKANILNPAFTEIGVGCTRGPQGQLCGQLFLG